MNERGQRVTVRDLAKAAGVSTGTVSRALKNEAGLTEDTREMILAKARELGYDFGKLRPKRLRRLTFLLHRQHNNVASSPFYSPVLHGAEDVCREQGIVLSFMSGSFSDGLVNQIRLHAPDGIICAGYFEAELLMSLRATNKPVVLVDMNLRGYNSVNPDNRMGGYLATKHLIDIGRERIAFLSGSLGHYSIRERARGYHQALFEAGILANPAYEVTLEEDVELEQGVRDAMQTLLSLPKRPDAIFCYNDSAALIAMRYCQEVGLKVPLDMCLVGFDDISAAVHGPRPLTTIRVDKKALGRIGVELLLNNGTDQVTETIAPVELVIRQSTVL
jgi:DNA-binding LacI/PurR family transcriptional regulator